jgi:hypothetical protein
MHPTRRSIFIGTLVLALGALAGPAAAQSPSPAAANALHLVKDCSGFTGDLGSVCIITASNLDAIPVGSQYIYYGPELDNPMFTSSSMVLDAGNGNTAAGYCMVDDKNGPLGMCTFWAGTGTLAGFNAVAEVTVSPDGLWHVDGTYMFATPQ